MSAIRLRILNSNALSGVCTHKFRRPKRLRPPDCLDNLVVVSSVCYFLASFGMSAWGPFHVHPTTISANRCAALCRFLNQISEKLGLE